MSSAARDLLGADELSPLPAAQAMVHEAPPDPPSGPIRDGLAEDAAARVDRAVALMDAAVDGYNQRLAGVVEARMRGPKARKGTRFWQQPQAKALVDAHLGHDRVNPEFFRGETDSPAHIRGVEIKALDATYVIPDKTVAEISDAVRPVGLRIVADAASATAKSLGRPNTSLAAFDWSAVEAAVDSAVQQMLGAAARQATEVRRVLLDADSTAADLDEAIDRVAEAVRRGGNWLKIYGRTLATALAGDAALAAARALGVTHCQWISRRDDHVRPTHRIADGQERPIGSKYQVGAFRLRHPGDPEVLPEGIGEVANCRCGLIPAQPPPERAKAVGLVEHGTPGPARQLLATRPMGAMTNEDPQIGGPSVPEVSVPADVVAYRRMDGEVPVEPGQRISWPGTLTLALAPSAAVVVGGLAVAIPAGATVGVVNGAVVLPAGASLAVTSVTQGQVVATPVLPTAA